MRRRLILGAILLGNAVQAFVPSFQKPSSTSFFSGLNTVPSATKQHVAYTQLVRRLKTIVKNAPESSSSSPSEGAPGEGQGQAFLEFGTPPMPLGGESKYEGYDDSSYTDQAAEMEYFADDELLAKYRRDLQHSNDQWQLNLFMKAQTGMWSGVWSEYVPVVEQGANGDITTFRMNNIYKGRQECVGNDQERYAKWRDLTLPNAADGAPLQPVLLAEYHYLPEDFQAGKGSMTADNVFSMSSVKKVDEGNGEEVFDAEIWIRQKNYRTRVQFLYTSSGETEPFQINKLIVKKERFGKAGPTAEEPELFGANGQGIYDPTSRMHESWDLSLHGGLSLCFPPALPRDKKGCLIVDWTAGDMRFQADRLFDRPDGSLGSLEVTQISTQASKYYIIPDEAQKDKGEGEAAEQQQPEEENQAAVPPPPAQGEI